MKITKGKPKKYDNWVDELEDLAKGEYIEPENRQEIRIGKAPEKGSFADKVSLFFHYRTRLHNATIKPRAAKSLLSVVFFLVALAVLIGVGLYSAFVGF